MFQITLQLGVRQNSQIRKLKKLVHPYFILCDGVFQQKWCACSERLGGKTAGEWIEGLSCFFSIVFYFTPLFKKEQKIKGKYSHVNIGMYTIQVTAF